MSENTNQVNYGWGVTLDMTHKVPAINKRIFNTYQDALAFANDLSDSAIGGLLLTVIADGENNGVYFVKKAKMTSNDNAELVKLTQDSDNVNAERTKLSSSITIEGGPLASKEVKDAFEDGVIPAGTDIQEILKALLCVEKYPNPTANTPGYTVSITGPSVTNSSDISNNGLVEVGQKITFNSVTAVTVTASTITNPKVSKFDYGYSTVLTGGTINPATAVTTTWNIRQNDNTFYKLSAAITGFTNSSVPTTVTATTNSTCVLSGCTLTAVLGTNTYKVTEEAPQYIGTHSGITNYYIVSNLSGRSDEHKSPSIPANTGLTKTASSTATTFTVKGVYPCYSNIKNNAFIGDATVRLNLTTGNTFTFESVPTEVNSTYNFMFDYPTTHSISSFLVKDLQGNWVNFTAFYNDKSGPIEKTIQGTKYQYYRLTTGGGNGPGAYKITLNKNLNQ